jgi:hypothetical protein
MRPRAKPLVGLGTRVPVETDDLRRRLQARTGDDLPELISKALSALERELGAEAAEGCSRSGAPA